MFAENWSGNPGTEKETVDQFENQLGLKLPSSYRTFLSVNNGGEGRIPIEPGIVILWKCEEIIHWNKKYAVDEVPGFLAIGSNGAGEAYVVDTRNAEWPVFSSPWAFYGESEYLVPISADFQGLLQILGSGR